MEWLLSFIPTKLPIGREEFNEWAAAIIRLAKVPDNSSTRFALGVMIMHRPPTESSKPKRFFAKQLYKAAVNEVAHALISEIKEEQQREKVAATTLTQAAGLSGDANAANAESVKTEVVCEAKEIGI